jgi:hypothetical protein
MALSKDAQDLLSHIRREVEAAVYSPPAWALDRVKEELVRALMKSFFNQTLAEKVAKSIADAFREAILLSVAQEFHRIAAQEVAHGMEGLSFEMAQIRAAFRRNLDEDDWWRHGPADTQEQDGQQDPPAE